MTCNTGWVLNAVTGSSLSPRDSHLTISLRRRPVLIAAIVLVNHVCLEDALHKNRHWPLAISTMIDSTTEWSRTDIGRREALHPTPVFRGEWTSETYQES